MDKPQEKTTDTKEKPKGAFPAVPTTKEYHEHPHYQRRQQNSTSHLGCFAREPVVGLEPTTRALRMRCSTTELYRRRGGQGIAGQANVKVGEGMMLG